MKLLRVIISLSTLSFLFLYTFNPEHWKTVPLLHTLVIFSLVLLTFFFVFYVKLFIPMFKSVLRSLNPMKKRGFSGFVNRNFVYIVMIFALSSPIILTLTALLRGFAFYFPFLEFLFPLITVLLSVFAFLLIVILLQLFIDAFKQIKQTQS